MFYFGPRADSTQLPSNSLEGEVEAAKCLMLETEWDGKSSY